MHYARNILNTEACLELGKLVFEQIMLKYDHSQFGYYCPVTWVVEKKLQKCHHQMDTAIKYKNQLFFFASEEKK